MCIFFYIYIYIYIYRISMCIKIFLIQEQIISRAISNLTKHEELKNF